MKKLIILLILLFTEVNLLNGQIYDTSTVCKTNYQHLIIVYNDNLLKYTSIATGYDNSDLIVKDFCSFENMGDIGVFFPSGVNCKLQFFKIPGIDTINTIRWLNADLPHKQWDSTIVNKKCLYSYVLNKFNEQRLDKDSIIKIRLLLPEDNFSGQGIWRMYKVLFYKDSTVFLSKRSDVINNSRTIINSTSKKLKSKEKESLLKYFEILNEYNGYECIINDYYPWLLEYYDGTMERCFIFSNNCKEEKTLKKNYEKIIVKLFNYSPNFK